MPNLEPEMQRALELVPRLDFTDPLAVRAAMDGFLQMAIAAGIWPSKDDAVEVIDRRAGSSGIAVRLYLPRERPEVSPAVLYCHGGAFVLGNLDLEHPRCLEMAKTTGFVVISVDYRLAPEHPFPAAVEDCWTVFDWAVSSAAELGIDGSRVAVAGASAGATLAAAVALMARDRGGLAPRFQLLLYPVTDNRLTTPSMTAFVDIPGWNRRNSEHMWRHYLGGADPSAASSPYAAPARSEDLRNLPPAYVMTSDFDAVRDEGLEYAQRLIEAGVPTELHHYPGTFHAFDTLSDTAMSRRARAECYAVLGRALGG